MSIKFGLTEKERILQLAREEDDEPCIPSTSQSTAETAVLQAAIKRGPEFFQSIDVTLRPIIPFRNRPKLPRALRQKVLDKLTGQHLALETVLNSKVTSNDALTLVPSSSVPAADVCLAQRSIAAAVEQEADIYERCSSAQVYQNLAARSSALHWRKEVRAAAEAEKAYEELLAVQRKEERKNKQDNEDGRQRKKSKLQKDTTTVDTTINTTKTTKHHEGPLIESDLDWNQAKPDTSEDVQRQKLRRRVVQALESCPKWSLLHVDQRVETVERCTLKIFDKKVIKDAALQQLAMQYIDFMIKKRKR